MHSLKLREQLLGQISTESQDVSVDSDNNVTVIGRSDEEYNASMEMIELSNEIDRTVDQLTQLAHRADGLEAIADTIDRAQAGGAQVPIVGRCLLSIATDMATLGSDLTTDDVVPSLESIDEQVSTEGIKETSAAMGKYLKDAYTKLVEVLKALGEKFKSFTDATGDRLSTLKEKFKSLSVFSPKGTKVTLNTKVDLRGYDVSDFESLLKQHEDINGRVASVFEKINSTDDVTKSLQSFFKELFSAIGLKAPAEGETTSVTLKHTPKGYSFSVAAQGLGNDLYALACEADYHAAESYEIEVVGQATIDKLFSVLIYKPKKFEPVMYESSSQEDDMATRRALLSLYGFQSSFNSRSIRVITLATEAFGVYMTESLKAHTAESEKEIEANAAGA